MSLQTGVLGKNVIVTLCLNEIVEDIFPYAFVQTLYITFCNAACMRDLSKLVLWTGCTADIDMS